MSNTVTQWLEQLGLGQYAEAFEENAIGSEHLAELDHDTLKEIGVRAVGHRMSILKAASESEIQVNTEAARETDAAAPDSLSFPEAERRQLTVMFCDLVDSTELSQTLDAEDLREVNRAYQDACKAAIERYEGYVARYMGDGVLAYFGYPQAHEDDADRAIHAGLGLVDAISGLNETVGNTHGVELGVRVGIATGPVVVGDLIGEGASQESAVVGETPNLAARYQALAARDAVVIGSGTHELVTGRFEYEDLGDHELKGIATPVRAWRVIAPAAAESRFEAAHQSGLTPLVGREHEIALLLERWEEAKAVDGQVVFLSGEAGIGKSRITQAIRERTAPEEPIRLRYQCSPYHTNSAFHPIVEQLERAAHFAIEDSPEARLDKLESLLAQSTQDVDAEAPLFAALLSIPAGGRYAPLEMMTPERQKERTLQALVAQMHGLCRHGPVLLIFEDVHWADPTSLELLELIVERAQTLPVMVVITFRPEFTPPWSGHTHITSLTLNRFSRGLVTAMVENVTGGKPLPDDVRDEIVEKTDGVPLFVEELTKTILESGLLQEEPDRYVLSGTLEALAIPATLHDSLMARLDRLGAVKEVAQSASAIGREFSYDLLAAVSSLSFRELQDSLDQLVDAELVFRRRRSAQTSYVFKHALVQDAAYKSLLRSKRRGLHARIAGVLEQRFRDTVENEPELLAHHYTEANLPKRAIPYWLRAGQVGTEHSANLEAIAHLTKGLRLVAAEPETIERYEQELDLQLAVGTALTATEGYAAAVTGDAYVRARDLGRMIGETPQLFPALYGVWNFHFVKCEDMGFTRELVEEFLGLAERETGRAGLVVAYCAMGQTLMTLGEFDSSRIHLEKSIALWDLQQDRSLGVVYGEHPGITSLGFQALASWSLGYPETAVGQSREALNRGYELSHANSTGLALVFAGWLHRCRRDPKMILEIAEELIAFATEQSLSFWLALGSSFRGWGLVAQGEVDEGIARIQEGLVGSRATGARVFVPGLTAMLAEGYHEAGRSDEGLSLISEALEAVEQTGEVWQEAELHWLKGELLLSLSLHNETDAETSFGRSIDVARKQQAKSLELRAAVSLALLWRSQGKRNEARDILAPIYGWFTEGFDTVDLKKAKTLLEQLT